MAKRTKKAPPIRLNPEKRDRIFRAIQATGRDADQRLLVLANIRHMIDAHEFRYAALGDGDAEAGREVERRALAEERALQEKIAALAGVLQQAEQKYPSAALYVCGTPETGTEQDQKSRRRAHHDTTLPSTTDPDHLTGHILFKRGLHVKLTGTTFAEWLTEVLDPLKGGLNSGDPLDLVNHVKGLFGCAPGSDLDRRPMASSLWTSDLTIFSIAFTNANIVNDRAETDKQSYLARATFSVCEQALCWRGAPVKQLRESLTVREFPTTSPDGQNFETPVLLPSTPINVLVDKEASLKAVRAALGRMPMSEEQAEGLYNDIEPHLRDVIDSARDELHDAIYCQGRAPILYLPPGSALLDQFTRLAKSGRYVAVKTQDYRQKMRKRQLTIGDATTTARLREAMPDYAEEIDAWARAEKARVEA